MYMQHNQDVHLKPLKDIQNYQQPADESRHYGTRTTKSLAVDKKFKKRRTHKSRVPELTLDKKVTIDELDFNS